MKLEGKKVLVFGTGKSGIGAVELLADQKAEIVLYDGNSELNPQDIQRKCGNRKVKIVLGDIQEELVETLDLIVMSPGVPTDLPIVDGFRAHGIPIWGEVELAYQCGKGDVLAITGTNGKTTTTALLGEIMRNAKDSVYVVGNIGTPYTSVVGMMKEETVTVAEISSFQLETIQDFHPRVSAILNITPDHLNRHHTMECYIAMKERITENQTKDDICVLNYEDEVLRKFGNETDVKVSFFSSAHILEEGIWLDQGEIRYSFDGKQGHLCHVDDLQLLGTHNYENVMAAAAMALAYGVDEDTVIRTICGFAGVEHRIEYVTEKNGVAYYNDSKGTNPDAAIRGICAMNRPTYLIGGGYDKGSSYGEWIDAFQGKVRELVLIGATKDKIAAEAEEHGFHAIVKKDTFEEAVAYCAAKAKPGEAVLLSPACASWDMFKSYEQRGEIFKELVKML
jgi:UDP-N-acetylmuramoylalanine--D-glutamate ligase